MIEKLSLATLQAPSTSFTSDATFTHPGGSAELKYEFERDGTAISGGIQFQKVRAFRFRSESHCTLWHIEGAYDTLVEIVPSEWSQELIEAQPRDMRSQWVIRHFMIYLDSSGAFEVAAAGWMWLPEVVSK